MELTEKAQLGRQHTRNSLAIAHHLSSLSENPNTGRFQASSDCQSQKSIKTSGAPSVEKSAKGSWIFSASDEYLAMLDKAGVIPMHPVFRVNDHARAWAEGES